ncbi:MAG: class II aldolase/adducin family protein [Saprospiraceae bacterium]
MDEGYIKFKAVWKNMPPPTPAELSDLPFWRDAAHRQGLIGVYGNGTGYGNISRRLGEGGSFVITGSATGHRPTLEAAHFTTVTGVDVVRNTVYCEGPVIASSESMSHAVVYQSSQKVNGVIHAHHAGLWEYLLGKVPTTGQEATYGTPEMARSIIGLFERTNVAEQKIFVMEGHPEGIFTFGQNLREALRVLELWLEKVLN